MESTARQSLLLRVFRCLAFVGLVTVGLPGCAPTQEQKTAEVLTPAEQVAWEMFHEKLRVNAADVPCEQSSYTSCFDIIAEHCIKEVSPFTADCYDRAQTKVGNMTSKETATEFSSVLIACIIFQHMSQYPDEHAKIAACLEDYSVGEAQIRRSVLK